MVLKKCIGPCGLKKELSENNFHFRKDTKKWRTKCKQCEKIYFYELNIKNKEKKKQYRNDNCDKIRAYDEIYREQNKERRALERKLKRELFDKENNIDRRQKYIKEGYSSQEEYDRAWKREYEKKRKQEDSAYKLRVNISIQIKKVLKRHGGSKNGQSCLKKLPYSFQELNAHIESLFEPWMNWNNQGNYHPETWDDNDTSTWTWQIDHITPQSMLSYDSLEHPNFLKCWALSNLRPFSAKQNILDGTTRVRHKLI